MDAQTAQLVLYAITAIGAVVWLAGLRFLIASYRAGKPPPAEQFDLGEPPPDNLVLGAVEVEGRPADLAREAASVLAKENMGPPGQLKILQRTDDRVAFEGIGQHPGSRSLGQCAGRGQLRFRPAGGDRTCIDYRIELSGGRGLLLGGAICQLTGLIALIVGFWAIGAYVVPNQDPAIRGQTFQMAQVVHFLWPPFLFGALYRRRRRAVRDGLEILIHNLPYHG